RHALVEPEAGLAERHADGLRFDDLAEFALHRLRGVAGDDLEAVAERQACLDAAHDHVDRVGEPLNELPLAPLLEEAQHPARQAESGRKAYAEGGWYPRARDERPREGGHAEAAADQQELAFAQAQPGLRDAHREGRRLGVLAPDLDLLE